MALNCIDTLVGLSNRNCECFEEDRPEGYNASTSGYFLTDSEYGFPLLEAAFANLNCNEANVWDMLSNAKSDAIRDFKSDLLAALLNTREKYVTGWRGLIGKAEGKQKYSSVKNYVGVQLSPRRLKHASLVIKAIWLGLDTTKDVTLTISSTNSAFEPIEVIINCEAGKYARKELPEAIILPLYDIAISDLRYNLRYEPDGALPYQNKIWCCNTPEWLKHLTAVGFAQDAFAEDFDATSNFASGLAIEGYLDCANLDWICDLEELNGYEVLDVVARCIQFKGAMKLISAVRESGRVNKYTLLESEGMGKKYGILNRNYTNYVNWLAQNMPSNASSCWGCERNAQKRGAILV